MLIEIKWGDANLISMIQKQKLAIGLDQSRYHMECTSNKIKLTHAI